MAGILLFQLITGMRFRKSVFSHFAYWEQTCNISQYYYLLKTFKKYVGKLDIGNW